jgi:hypothetical protein
MLRVVIRSCVKSFTSARAFSAQNGFERRANAMAEKPTKTPVPDWLAADLGVNVASAAIFLFWVWFGV